MIDTFNSARSKLLLDLNVLFYLCEEKRNTNPTSPKSWIDDLEKAFDACAIPDDRKLSLAVF